MGRKKRKWRRKADRQYMTKYASWQIKDGESVLVAEI